VVVIPEALPRSRVTAPALGSPSQREDRFLHFLGCARIGGCSSHREGEPSGTLILSRGELRGPMVSRASEEGRTLLLKVL
jgi:hypothetical protein